MQFYTDTKLEPKQALLALAVLSMMVGLRSSSDAQTPNGATDNELYAAYCAGALTEKSDELASMTGSKPTAESVEQGMKQLSEDLFRQTGNPKAKLSPEQLHQLAQTQLPRLLSMWENMQASKATVETRRRRFVAYLLSTGILTDTKRLDAATGLLLSRSQGIADSKQCFADTNRCFVKYSKDQKAYTACIDTTACRQMGRCWMPDSLPF
jgi:hypothetical protein